MVFKLRMITPCQSFFRKLLSSALALTLTVAFAQAETYISTLGTINPDLETELLNDLMLGFAFTTDSQTYQLNSITTRFHIGGNTGLDLGAKIFEANSSGYPISEIALGTFSHPSLSVSDVTFTANGNIELAANSTYIFVIAPGNQNVGGFSWYATEAVTPGEGWNVVNGIFYKDGAESWSQVTPEGYVLMASVDATAIPEPSTWVLLGGAGAALIGWQRRRCSHA